MGIEILLKVFRAIEEKKKKKIVFNAERVELGA